MTAESSAGADGTATADAAQNSPAAAQEPEAAVLVVPTAAAPRGVTSRRCSPRYYQSIRSYISDIINSNTSSSNSSNNISSNHNNSKSSSNNNNNHNNCSSIDSSSNNSRSKSRNSRSKSSSYSNISRSKSISYSNAISRSRSDPLTVGAESRPSSTTSSELVPFVELEDHAQRRHNSSNHVGLHKSSVLARGPGRGSGSCHRSGGQLGRQRGDGSLPSRQEGGLDFRKALGMGRCAQRGSCQLHPGVAVRRTRHKLHASHRAINHHCQLPVQVSRPGRVRSTSGDADGLGALRFLRHATRDGSSILSAPTFSVLGCFPHQRQRGMDKGGGVEERSQRHAPIPNRRRLLAPHAVRGRNRAASSARERLAFGRSAGFLAFGRRCGKRATRIPDSRVTPDE
ncbi:unnamed protein product, partial [Polarella glacialis]